MSPRPAVTTASAEGLTPCENPFPPAPAQWRFVLAPLSALSPGGDRGPHGPRARAVGGGRGVRAASLGGGQRLDRWLKSSPCASP